MPSTTEVCPKCKFGKLWAREIKNMYNYTDGYKVECPIRDCGYTGFRNYIERLKLI